MIAKPETRERIRAQAEAYAADKARVVAGDLPSIRDAIRAAYLSGADAGYTARCAEERE